MKARSSSDLHHDRKWKGPAGSYSPGETAFGLASEPEEEEEEEEEETTNSSAFHYASEVKAPMGSHRPRQSVFELKSEPEKDKASSSFNFYDPEPEKSSSCYYDRYCYELEESSSSYNHQCHRKGKAPAVSYGTQERKYELEPMPEDEEDISTFKRIAPEIFDFSDIRKVAGSNPVTNIRRQTVTADYDPVERLDPSNSQTTFKETVPSANIIQDIE
jgi:hypothetical protein